MARKKGSSEEIRDIRTFALPSVAPLMLTLIAMFSDRTRLPRIALGKIQSERTLAETAAIENLINTTFLAGDDLQRDSRGLLVSDTKSLILLSDTPKVFATGMLDGEGHDPSQEALAATVHKTFGAEGLRHFLTLVVFLEENSQTGYFQWNVNHILTEMGYERDPAGSFNIELKKKVTDILFLLTNLTIVARRKDSGKEEIKFQKLFHIDSRYLVKYANGIIKDTIMIQASPYWYKDAFFQDPKIRKGKQYTKLLRKIITENHWKHSITIYLTTLLSIFWRISRGKPRTLSVKNLADWCNIDLFGPNKGYHWKKVVGELTYMKDNEYLGDFKVRRLRTSDELSPGDLIDFSPPAWLNEEFERIRNKQEEIIVSKNQSESLGMTLVDFRRISQQLGLSNRDLAIKLKVSHTMVNMILSGKRRVSIEIGYRLRALLVRGSTE